MHTGPGGPLLFGWCTHYVPTTSHQPPASFCTAPAPPCTLRARLHCHMWTCPSIHVSLCLEEFSPQTSPSGTNYPMVGVLSMCPPHHFSQIPTSGHPCRPAWCRWDISLVSNRPIGMSFGPWNISQSLPVKGATTNVYL